MVLDQSQFLDIYDIWVNELIGDVWLFAFIGLITICYLTIKSKMPTEVALLFAVLFLSIMFSKTGITSFWVFTVLGVGTLFYYKLKKAIE